MAVTTKEYFTRYQDLRRDVDALTERRDYYMQLAQKCTTAYGQISGGGSVDGSKVSRNVDKAVDKARELEQRLAELVDLEEEIEETIGRVPNDVARDVLTYRYINGWDLRVIADKMGYSREYMRHLHSDALDMVEIPEKYRA